MSYKYIKSSMERYDIRIGEEDRWRCAWAVVSISEDGFFNAQTDCGDFSYRWNSFGDCFKTFFLEMNKDYYFYSKIAEREDRVDIDETVKPIKELLFQKRRNREISRFDASCVWDEILEIENDCDGISSEGLYYALSSMTSLNSHIPEYYDGLDVQYKPDNKAKTFCEVVLPVLIDILKKELKEEK